MDFSYVLNASLPQIEKLKSFGFSENKGELVLKKNLPESGFYVVIRLSENSLAADVFESLTDEKYVLFNVPSAQGSFVGNLRSEVQVLVNEIREKCFVCGDLKKKYLDFLRTRFNVSGDTPWADEGDTESTVFRCPNNKWFALLMNIKFKSLGIESEEPVWAVNLKTVDAVSVADRKSIFPAYHMNKKYWITVLLTSVTDFNQLCELTEKSYELVAGKKGREMKAFPR